MHLVNNATSAVRKTMPAPNGPDRDVERLAAILRQIAFRADDLIAAVRKSGGPQYQDSVRRLERQLRRTQADLEQLDSGMAQRASSALRAMDSVAYEHPYAAAAASMLVGAALGTFMAVVFSRR